MDVASSNQLMSSQKSSELQAVLHPLVLLTISDYITRHTLREQEQPIIGALLGQQNGREISIEHAFECHVRAAPETEGGYLLDDTKFAARLEQMTLVHKDRNLELVGWYTLLPSNGPSRTIIPIHKQILSGYNESALLLGFHPEAVLNHSVGGKLPLTIYESNYEVDDPKTTTTANDGEDQPMADGDTKLKLKFREMPYSVETDETEMISMNYVAAGGGSAAAGSRDENRPSRSVETNGKGKRRLVEADTVSGEAAQGDLQEEDVLLTRAEEEMVAALTNKVNAVKMLQSRIELITAYLRKLPQSYLDGNPVSDADAMDSDSTVPSLVVLRQIQALVSRLNLAIPSDKESYDTEMLHEQNNVNLISMLDRLMQSVKEVRSVGKKFQIVETTKAATRRGGPGAGPGEFMPGNYLHASPAQSLS